MKKLFLIFLLGFVVVTGFEIYSFLSPQTTDRKQPIKAVIIDVKHGERFALIAENLVASGIIRNARMFYIYARILGQADKIKAGEYRFTTVMTPSDVLNVLCSGISYGFPLTLPEGFSLQQISAVVEKFHEGYGAEFLALTKNLKFISSFGLPPKIKTLEGYLFPDTYLIARDATVEDIVRTMVKHYQGVFNSELKKRAEEVGMTEHQVVTLASIVEKETGAEEERPLIASIFLNRLKKKMRLQTDPTVIYGIRDYDGNITRKDLERDTPYNTYRIPGLPPGPICSPGKEAIRAVLYPAQSEFLYFVSHNDGTHEFTKTYEDHRKAVVKFQLDPKMREGKSWRDLKKNQLLKKQ